MLEFSIISIVIAVIAIFVQFKYFRDNKKRLEEAKNFFLQENSYALIAREGCKSRIISPDVENRQLQKLIEELNKYIETNEGTTDFSIIQNKTERYSTTIFENASSNLAFPTYIGLMGTFAGVFLGLIGFEWPEIKSYFVEVDPGTISEGDNVSRLVGGVIVSMITSLIGLVLTTISNYKATEYKRILDGRKNLFYDFVQNELMPSLGTSVVAALNNLKETLGNFHKSFDVITKNFETTFNGCTERFGNKFKENIDAIANATDKLGSSINAVNENVERQKELLKELRSNGMIEALDKFISASKQFEKATTAMEDMNEVRTLLNSTTKELINTQKEYMSSLVVPKKIAEQLNSILDRVSTFEDSVNELGGTLHETQIIGNSEISMINEHLDLIRRKNSLAQEYLETADEKLQDLYSEQTRTIGELTAKYATAIAEHMDEFYVMMERVSKEIDAKKKLFMDKLENAFDVAIIKSEFAQLNHLPLIADEVRTLEGLLINKDILMQSIKDIITQIKALNTEIKCQSSNYTDSLNKVDESVKANVSASEKTNDTLQTKYAELLALLGVTNHLIADVQRGKEDLKGRVDGIESNVGESIQEAEGHLKESIKKSLKKSVDEMKAEISVLKTEIDRLFKNISTVDIVDFGSIDRLKEKIDEQERAINKLALSIEQGTLKVEKLNVLNTLGPSIDSMQKRITIIRKSLEDLKTPLEK